MTPDGRLLFSSAFRVRFSVPQLRRRSIAPAAIDINCILRISSIRVVVYQAHLENARLDRIRVGVGPVSIGPRLCPLPF
jgi:hypothetical protein